MRPRPGRPARWLRGGTVLWLLFAPAGASALPPPQEVALQVARHAAPDVQTLQAYLYRPATAGPQPAVVDLHGCNGIWPRRSQAWLELYLPDSDIGIS